MTLGHQRVAEELSRLQPENRVHFQQLRQQTDYAELLKNHLEVINLKNLPENTNLVQTACRSRITTYSATRGILK